MAAIASAQHDMHDMHQMGDMAGMHHEEHGTMNDAGMFLMEQASGTSMNPRSWRMPNFQISSPASSDEITLRIGSSVPPVNDGFAFQRSTRAFFRCFSAGLGSCPNLLDAVEEQVPAVLLVKRHRIVVAKPGGFYPGSDQYPTIEEVGSR